MTSSNLIPEGAINVTVDVKEGEPIYDPNLGNISGRIMTYSYQDETGRVVTDEVPLTETGIGLLAVDILEVATVEEALPYIMKGGASGTTFETSYGYDRLDSYNRQSTFTADGLSQALSAEFFGDDRQPEGFEIDTSADEVVIKKKLGKGFAKITLSPRKKIDQDLINKWENLTLEDLSRKDQADLDDEKVLDFTEMLTDRGRDRSVGFFSGATNMTFDGESTGGAQVSEYKYPDYSNKKMSKNTRKAIALLKAANLNPESLKGPFKTIAVDDPFLEAAKAISATIPEDKTVEETAIIRANIHGRGDEGIKAIIRQAVIDYHK